VLGLTIFEDAQKTVPELLAVRAQDTPQVAIDLDGVL
jgi:hypothetical protein